MKAFLDHYGYRWMVHRPEAKMFGKQAVVINEIVQKMFVNGESITDEELKELVGHTHVEVIGGVIVGLLTAGLFLLFM